MKCKNEVHLVGTVTSPFQFHHSYGGKDFYLVNIATKRLSDTVDTVKVLFFKDDIDLKKDLTGRSVEIKGSYRSHVEEGRLFLSVLAEDFSILDGRLLNENKIKLEGFIKYEAELRKTPKGRTVADTLVVCRKERRKDYIPIIAWGRNAIFLSGLPKSARVKIEGRIQSRNYPKCNEDGVVEIRGYNEVSVCKIEEIKDEG